MKSTLAVSFSLLSLAAVACSHESPPPADTTSTTAAHSASQQQPVSQAQIDRIATVMCEREQSCTNIGPGHKYATRDTCMMENRASNMNDLTKAHCPSGIDAKAFETCLADIKADKCDNPIDHLERINSCSEGSLCPR